MFTKFLVAICNHKGHLCDPCAQIICLWLIPVKRGMLGEKGQSQLSLKWCDKRKACWNWIFNKAKCNNICVKHNTGQCWRFLSQVTTCVHKSTCQTPLPYSPHLSWNFSPKTSVLHCSPIAGRQRLFLCKMFPLWAFPSPIAHLPLLHQPCLMFCVIPHKF